MATNIVTAAREPEDEGDDESKSGESKTPVPYAAPTIRSGTDGFFTIYKRGQGKWTRLGTVFVALLLGVLTAFSIYQNSLPYLVTSDPDPTVQALHTIKMQHIMLGVSVGFLALFCIFVYRVTNKPKNVDFLIATDSEMKKVNWTTQGELFGSTRVVVLFLFFIAVFLSVVDLVFYGFFHLIGVLQ